MSQTQHGLGGRLPLLKPDALSPAQKNTYDTIDTTMVPWAEKSGFQAKNEDGTLIGPFNGILLSPAITDAFLALQAAEQEHTTLTARVRQIVILTVGAVWQCDYERYAHEAVARKAGLPDEAIRSLSKGIPAGGLAFEEELAQQFTRQVTVERQVEDNLYVRTEAIFGAQGIVDLLYLAGCYDTISSLLNTFRVPAPAR
ncbi:carboxymuconolactone decarboxylase family protein [Methylobacterium sp. WL64]|uniref:carboxymuconolactone decarboxylase family protein n=1 Tax=Methylobacterium sp. WL64 TaxID=2603894 RepID=UPI0011CC3B57|nr:carboxymuconolactone decarboxylase family protein [Methylobacterium sp. WL64]TXM99027.1 carboxymuconolactone decarboxylase family protein [Methylobacterium sp. WL64]